MLLRNQNIESTYSNRNTYFDVIRLLAMFLVIGVHVVGSVKEFAQTSSDNFFVCTLDTINELGVPLFFALSGLFLLQKPIMEIKSWYVKHALRIFIPYAGFAVLYVAYFTIIEQHNIKGFVWSYIKGLLCGQVHGTHWFVYAILGFYFITPFLSRMFARMSDKEVTLLVAAIASIKALDFLLSLFGENFAFQSIVFDSANICYYVGGYCIYRIVSNNTYSGHLTGNVILKFICIVLCCFLKCFRDDTVWTYFIVLLAFSPVVCAEPEGKAYICFKNFLSKIIKHSYSIYLIHAAVISALLKSQILSLPINYKIKVIIFEFLVFLISFFIAWIADNVVFNKVIGFMTEKFGFVTS